MYVHVSQIEILIPYYNKIFFIEGIKVFLRRRMVHSQRETLILRPAQRLSIRKL